MPNNNPYLTAIEIILPKASITMTNNRGDRGFPCLKLRKPLKNPVGVLLPKT